ncbi:MAG TPA: peptidyl-prolyl cis-trans isomerase [Candidatus Polarisedimenticolia bacterium]|nr:peptidyl-prolyl cis-trans isomerase [Candidatus Polarisedimenticolia bacterium]
MTRSTVPVRTFPRALAAAALLTAATLAAPARAAIVEEIVAKVNNRIITKSEYEQRSLYLVQQTKGSEDEMQAAKDALLANLITEALLIERAETIFDMERIRTSLIEDFRKQQNIANDEELETALKDQGMTRKELEEHLMRLAVPNEIINYDVKRKISVSDAEMQAFYDQHRSRWETPTTVTLREIVVTYVPETRDEARARARGLATQAREGGDFIEMVKESSEGGTREVEGILGPVAAKDLHPALNQAALALKIGEISDPVDTGRALHIVKLEARVETTVKTLADVKDEVYNAVREEKFRPKFDNYLKKLWKENYIEVEPKYEPLLVISPLKKPVAGAAAGAAAGAP